MYIDALYDREKEIIKVVERVNGKRNYINYPVDHHFYVDDPRGTHRTIYNTPVAKITPKTAMEKNKLIKMNNGKTWESDINPVLRCLEQNYKDSPLPNPQVAFFDIEVDFDPVIGYSSAQEAANPITAIAVHLQWLNQTVCLAIPPKTITMEEAEEAAKRVGNVLLFECEGELLQTFLTLIEDADILSGWNSDFFDIVYTTNRIIRLYDENETRKLCLWNLKPKKKEIERGGEVTISYELLGRIHLDYMDLYKKYRLEERQSYSLDNISSIELGDSKVPYEGTLDHLYKYDFEKFLRYNIQDTELLGRLDDKLRYISLANSVAHTAPVRIQDTMGTVTTTETSIVVQAHAEGLIVPDKKRGEHGKKAAGGWVSEPKTGLKKWIGVSDINSLYPSTIRALNMSPETIIGQIRTDETDSAIENFIAASKKNSFALWWNDRFSTLEMENYFSDNISNKLILDMEDGKSYTVTGADLRALILESGKPWAISANGTIFSFEKEGIIPKLLATWYFGRKIMQAYEGGYEYLIDTNGIELPSNLKGKISKLDIPCTADGKNEKTCFDKKQLETLFNDVVATTEYLKLHGLTVVNDKIVAIDQKLNREYIGYWNQQQQTRKILLNALYGGLLNEHHRFYDQRLGQSTTLTGRCITRHMVSKTNELITGEYDHYGSAAIYSDTDSSFFTAYEQLKPQIESGEIEWTKESVIKLYDEIANLACDSFPAFLNSTFNVPLEKGAIIKSSREVVATTGIFIKKKRYALMVYDKEGKRQDVKGLPGKHKVTGLDLKRSDTPKRVQAFLSGILNDVLTDVAQDDIIAKIRDFKEEYYNLDPWLMGVPKSVNGLSSYKLKLEAYMADKMKYSNVAKPTIPGHVNGSLNWNHMVEINNDRHTTKVLNGSKIVVCQLKETDTNKMSSIAYPTDEKHLPDWFTSLPFDKDIMLESVVDGKIQNLLGVLKWDLSRTDKKAVLRESLFDFSKINV